MSQTPSYDKTKKYQGWCFTINNYTDEDVAWVMVLDAQGVVAGREESEEGTPHIQGAVYFKNKDKKRFAAMKKMHDRAHWEPMKGSWEDNRKYCTKEGDVIVDEGEGPKQGKRMDLTKMKRRIDEGATEEELWEEDFSCMARYGRAMKEYKDLKQRKKARTGMTKGKWYYGPTGVGKSHTVFSDFDPDTHYVYEVEDNGWWDGYEGQDIVIINEFRGQIKFAQLLDLVDKYPKKVKRRNRETTPFVAKEVRVTSSMPPEEVYNGMSDKIDQLLRRFTVYECTKEGNAYHVEERE